MLGKTCTEREHASDLRPRPRRRRRGRRRRSRGLFSLCTRDNKRLTDTVERRGGDFTPSLPPPRGVLSAFYATTTTVLCPATGRLNYFSHARRLDLINALPRARLRLGLIGRIILRRRVRTVSVFLVIFPATK